MKKTIILLLLCSVLLGFQTHQKSLSVLARKQGLDWSIVDLFYAAEALQMSTSNDCYADTPTDSLWAVNSAATISDTAERYGTYGLNIPGNSDWIELECDDDYTNGSSTLEDFGVSTSIYVDRKPIGGLINFFRYGESSERVYLRLEEDGDVTCFIDCVNGSMTATTTDTPLATEDTWYVVQCSIDATPATATDTLEIYINGTKNAAEVTTGDCDGPTLTTAAQMEWGNLNSTATSFNGKFDNLILILDHEVNHYDAGYYDEATGGCS